MNRYTVIWDTDVEAEFIRAWIACDSHSRQTLTEVANWIDSHLAEDPEQQGMSRPDLQARILAVPLTSASARVSVTYQILHEDRQVRVVRLNFQAA